MELLKSFNFYGKININYNLIFSLIYIFLKFI